MKDPTMPCPKCDGKGTCSLPTVLRETLDSFGSRSILSAVNLVEASKAVTHSALNNRLEKLRTLGFLTRERDGKLWKYRLAKA